MAAISLFEEARNLFRDAVDPSQKIYNVVTYMNVAGTSYILGQVSAEEYASALSEAWRYIHSLHLATRAKPTIEELTRILDQEEQHLLVSRKIVSNPDGSISVMDTTSTELNNNG